MKKRQTPLSETPTPTILIQTPYNKDAARLLWFGDAGTEPLLASTDYAFVVVDWRGFFGSTAARLLTNPQPYGEDGYDTVEWIAAQPFSDGKVGTWGVSALCQQQYRTAVEQPPHLSAAVPIFCEMNQAYDQYYPGGVLRREYFTFISTYFGLSQITNAPYRTPFWVAVETALPPADVQVPMMLVAGWFDLYPSGQLRTWNQLQASSTRAAEHRLLIGDWIHFATGGEQAGGRSLSAEELQYVDSARVIQRDSRFCGRGKPCVSTVDSRATMGRGILMARLTSLDLMILSVNGMECTTVSDNYKPTQCKPNILSI